MHVARIMSPQILEWFVQKLTKEFTPERNFIILSGPSNIGKSVLFKPIFDIYKNVTTSDFTNFSLDDCMPDEILFCDNINPCLKYNKNELFKNSSVATALLDGKPYGSEGVGKIIFSITRDNILYVDSKLGTRMLVIELPYTTCKFPTDNTLEINENMCGSMIINFLLDSESIKEYMYEQRLENKWERNVYINGRLYKDDQILHEPLVYYYKYNFDRHEDYLNLKDRL
jgi:hypothetical protein